MLRRGQRQRQTRRARQLEFGQVTPAASLARFLWCARLAPDESAAELVEAVVTVRPSEREPSAAQLGLWGEP